MIFFLQLHYRSDLMGMKGIGWLALSSPQIESAKKAGELISEVPLIWLYHRRNLAFISSWWGKLQMDWRSQRAPWPLDSWYFSGAICKQIPRQNKISLPVNSLAGELKACSSQAVKEGWCVRRFSREALMYNCDLSWPIILGEAGRGFATHLLSLLRESSVWGLSDFRGC